MLRAWLVVPVLVIATADARQSPWTSDLGNGRYANPVLHADYSDPDAIRVGDAYYMTASSFASVPGLPILKSTDLVNWELVGHALRRLVPEDAFALPQHGKGVWAPAIRHHAGRFWIYYPDPDRGIYAVTASDPTREWSAPALVKAGKGLIDPCPLWDDDGRVYLVHAWARSRAGFANVLTLNRLTDDGLHVADEGRVIVNGDELPGYTTLEGPKIYKRGGYYWIFAPAGGVQRGWQSVFRSRAIDGPYESRIVLRQGTTAINGPHQGAWVEDAHGRHWFVHFQDKDAYGRVVHLQPMSWTSDGWPAVGVNQDREGTGEPVLDWRKPESHSSVRVAPPTSDEFNGAALGLQWQWQANPRREWMSLQHGVLRLNVWPLDTSNLWLAPNLLLQKWPAPEFDVTAAVTFAPARAGESTGLIVFGRDYAWLGITETPSGVRLSLRIVKDADAAGTEREVAGVARVPRTIYLRVGVRDGARCSFSYSTDNVTFVPIAYEFTGRQGVWVGARVGLFARGAAGPSAGHADWEWFRVAAPVR